MISPAKRRPDPVSDRRRFWRVLLAIVPVVLVMAGGAQGQPVATDPAMQPDPGTQQTTGAQPQGDSGSQSRPESPAVATGAPLSIIPAPRAPGPYVPETTSETTPETTLGTAPGMMPETTLGTAPGPEQGPGVTRPGQETAAPSPPAAAGEPASTPAAEPASGVVEKSSDIAVSKLKSINPSSVGTLTDDNGGLGVNMWAGTRRALVDRLLPELPGTGQSEVLRDLRRRLLLTTANVPEGATSGPSLLGLRMASLAAAGDLDGLTGLIDLSPTNPDDQTISRARVDGLLLAADFARACPEARNLAQRSDDVYWLKVSGFCRVLDGDLAGASLALELLTEDGQDDVLYTKLLQAMMKSPGGSAPASIDIETFPKLEPLHLAMLRVTGQAVPLGAIVEASPLILHAVAVAPTAPLSTRLQAADAAVRIGALDATTLAQIFAAVDFSDGERKDAFLLANADIGAKADALLYQLALQAKDAGARAKALAAAWARGRRDGTYLIIARVNLEATRALKPSAKLMAQAVDAARALLLAGDTPGALDWYQVIRKKASGGDLDATKALLDLWPLLQIADPNQQIPWSDDILELWWQGQLILPAKERIARARVLFTLLEALGTKIPDRFWDRTTQGAVAESAPLPNIAIWRTLVAAAQDGRRGETVLLALLALGQGGVDGASPSILSSAVASLGAVGLTHEARALALEAALARGL